MIQVIYDIAIRLGLGLILGVLLVIFIMMLETAFYHHSIQIHTIAIILVVFLVIYALGDIAIDVFHI